MNEQRLLLPFVNGVNVEAVDYALHFSKAAQLPLVVLALIPKPTTGNVRAEYIQQANDFLETIESRAEMHALFIERHQYFSQNASDSILNALMQLDCQGVIIPFQNEFPCFIGEDTVKSIQDHTTLNVYLLHIPRKDKKIIFRSVQKAFSTFLHV